MKKVLRELVAERVEGVNSGCSDELTRFSPKEQQIERLTDGDGVRLLEEEEEEGELVGYVSNVGFPTTVEECYRRMAELQDEARDIRLRLLNDDDDKQFLWRRLGMIRDYVAEIQRALADDEPVG